jgi:hypothetical protein
LFAAEILAAFFTSVTSRNVITRHSSWLNNSVVSVRFIIRYSSGYSD